MSTKRSATDDEPKLAKKPKTDAEEAEDDVEGEEDVEEEESESRLVHSTGNGKLNSVHNCRNNNNCAIIFLNSQPSHDKI